MNNWKTTIAGVVLIVASIASVFVKNVTWSEAVIGFTAGVGLIAAKDHNNNTPATT
jgi:hypothetical protein